MDREEMLEILEDLNGTSKDSADISSTVKDYDLFLLANEGPIDVSIELFIKHLGFRPDAVMLVHPRNMDDVYARCPFLRTLEEDKRVGFLENLWPLVLDRATYMDKNILVLTLPLLPEYWFPNIEDREKHKHQKVVRDARWNDVFVILDYLEKRIGPIPIILGALTGRMSRYLIKNKIESPLICGINLTPNIITEMIEQIGSICGENPRNYKIALIGGAGQMGISILSWLIYSGKGKNMVVVEANQKRLEIIRQTFGESSNFSLSTEMKDIQGADIVIVATAASSSIIGEELLDPGTIVIDDTHPSNVDQSIPRSRNIILRVMASVPELEYDFPMDQLGSAESVTCFAEGCIALQETDEFIRQVESIKRLPSMNEYFLSLMMRERAKKLKITMASFRDEVGFVSDAEIRSTRELRLRTKKD